eukprot:gene47-9653_t
MDLIRAKETSRAKKAFHFAIILMTAGCVLYGSLKSMTMSLAIRKAYFPETEDMLERNSGPRLSSALDPETERLLEHEEMGSFHLVTTFVPFDHEDVKKGLVLNGLLPSDKEISTRMSEILDCLQRNLESKLVAFVHVLVYRYETGDRLQSLKMRSVNKLIIHYNFVSPTIMDAIVYASKYLKGKMVIILHQDNFLGEGWEKVNHKVLREKKLLYALTRHPSNCSAALRAAHCGPGSRYVGSHDAFALHIKDEEFLHDHLAELDVPPNTNGMENVLIWVFKERLKYKVLNPCSVLKVYHNHCTPVRDNWRKRVNERGMNGLALFTNKLE